MLWRCCFNCAIVKGPKQKINDSIRKMNNAVKDYVKIGGMSVNVGLPSDRIHGPSELPLAEVGAMHEFGAGNIPERSFLRSTVTLKQKEITDAMNTLSKKAANGEDPKKLMEQFALFGEGLVKERMRDLTDPPLKQPRADGSDNPLVDTGALRQGIIGIVVDD